MFARQSFVACQLTSTLLRRQKTAFDVVVNNLYSEAALGLTGYQMARDRTKHQFNQLEDKFKTKMTEFATSSSSSTTIFTEDLRHLVHLAEPNDNDLSLVRQMMVKFASQNREMRFGSFIFGPVVMRMYHYLNRPIEALDAFNDPALAGFFDQLGSLQILMDLLLKNELYDDVVAVFEEVKNKQLQGAKYPKNAVVLVLAACYLKSTKDSYEYVKNLWSDLNAVGHYPMRRAATFAAALALAHNEPGVALEILTNIRNQTYVTVRNLKVIALSDLGRPDDVLPIFRSSLEFSDSATGRRPSFFREVLVKLNSALVKLNNPELQEEFKVLLNKLESYGLVSEDELKTQLCSQIEAVPKGRRDDNNESFKVRQRTGRTMPERSGVFGQL